jgi:hypothetical protein
MRKFLVLIAVLFAVGCSQTGCASLGATKVQHPFTLSVSTLHQTLVAIDDTERLLVCGAASAPAPPQCVDDTRHREISRLLAQAFSIDSSIAKTVRTLAIDQPLPPSTTNEIADVKALVSDVLGLIPESPQKAGLVQRVQAR